VEDFLEDQELVDSKETQEETQIDHSLKEDQVAHIFLLQDISKLEQM